MTTRASMIVALKLVAWALTVAAVVAVGPPVDAMLSVGWLGPPVGALAGGFVFCLLARGRFPARRLRPRPSTTAARVGFLTVRSAYEEAVWRGLLLGGLANAVGPVAALALSTVGFAGSHWRGQGRRMVAHLVTGACFGAVYLTTGSLAAAIAAHATYNALVAVALALERGAVLVPTARFAPAPLASSGPAPAAPRCREPGAYASVPEGRPVAQVHELVKRFGATEALRGVSFELAPGELLGVLGPNGAGKTTLVSILVGLRRPDSGVARLLDADPRDVEPRRLIGVTPQDAGFSPTLRVAEVVDLVRAHYPEPAPTAELLERFGLERVASRQAGGLSGGQRRRLAVALAFAGRPRALFLDEPTAGLDVEGRQALWHEIRAFVADGGTVLLTSHQLDEVQALATRVVVIQRGVLVAEGTVAEIRARAGLARIRFEAAELPSLPGIEHAEREGGVHTLLVRDADAAVAALVGSGVPFTHLEVAPASLEDAFLGLTRGTA